MKIPEGGSFIILIWFKQDSRLSQTLISSSNTNKNNVNRKRGKAYYWETIDSFSVEIRGLSQIFRIRDRTNTKSVRDRLTETTPG
jgi:hypothetical protein